MARTGWPGRRARARRRLLIYRLGMAMQPGMSGAVLDGAGDEAGQRPARALVADGAVATRARGCWRGAASWWPAA